MATNLETKITLTALDRASASIRAVAGSFVGLKASAALVGRSFAGLDSSFNKFSSAFKSYTLQAAIAGAAIVGVVKKNADLGEQLLNNSQRAGITVEQLQKLGYAAEIAGIGADSINTSMKFLNKNLADAASDPKSDVAKAFKSMKIAVRDSNGEIRNAYDVFLQMSDVFQKTKDGGKEVKTSMTILGKAGNVLIPILNLGSKEIVQQGIELEKLGGIMSDEVAKKADAVGDNMQKIGFAFRGVSIMLSSQLMPIINKIVISTLEYVKANEAIIASNIKDVVSGIASSLHIVRFALQTVHAIIWPVIKALGGMKTVITVLSYIALASLTMKLGGVILAFAAFTRSIILFNVALFASPIGWFIAGVAAIAGSAYLIYKNWTPITAFFGNMWDRVRAIFKLSAVDIVKSFGALGAIFVPFIEGVKLAVAAIKFFKGSYDNVMQNGAPIYRAVKNIFRPDPAKDTPAIYNANSIQHDSNTFAASRFASTLAPAAQPQKLDIKMNINADGKPKDITATSSAPLTFKSNVGLLMP